MKTVFLIDDHPVVALGLTIALANAAKLKFAGVASEPLSGLAKLELIRPDCLVLDLVFAGSVELALVAHSRAFLPTATIIVFSSLPAKTFSRDAIEAGANAYLSKEADMSDLVALIMKLDDTLTTTRANTLSPSSIASRTMVIEGVHLTPREAQVAASVGRGSTVAAIAAELRMSPNTVAVHRENIRRKLNCRDTKDLVARLARSDRN